MKRSLIACLILALLSSATGAADDAEQTVERGNALVEAGKFDEAIAEYKRAIDMDPRSDAAYIKRGITYGWKHDYDSALADFDKALEIDPNNASAWRERGNACSFQREFDRAVEAYDKALAIDPDNPRVLLFRGTAHTWGGNYAKALADFDRVHEVAPADTQAYVGRAIAYERMGEYDKAIEQCDKAIEEEPGTWSVYTVRGNVHRDKGQTDLALADYAEAITKTPQDSWAYQRRGMLRFDLCRTKEAVEDFSKVIRLDPYKVFPRVWLFLAEGRMGKDDKAALAEFRKTLKIDDPEASVVRMFLGELTPEQCLAAAAHKNPKRDTENKCWAYYYIGQFHLLHGDKDRARQSFRDCVATDMKAYIEYWSAKAELERMDKLQ